MGWLRAHDPGLVAVRRAARVTIVACLGFYLCRYVLDNVDMAPYALFGAVALGVLSQIPGGGARRMRTLLLMLPVGAVLITLGTLLSFNLAAATAGMFVLGFAVSFVGVGGPRLVGLAAGTQLLYILPCFPPFAPGALGWRLAGFALAVILLALAERFLWPDPEPTPYTDRLADAVDGLSGCLAAVADAWSGRDRGRVALDARLPDAVAAADALRPSRLPPGQVPASASRRDRALTAASATVRLLLGRTAELARLDDRDAADLPAAAALLEEVSGCAEAASRWLRGTGEVPDTDRIAAALRTFRAERLAVSPDGIDPQRLRLGSLALMLGEWTKTLVTALRVVARAPIPPDPTPPEARPGQFWFAHSSEPELLWRRLQGHLTTRSVYFQGALRLAAALAAARLLAGLFDLSHGFWVLLTILTVLRTTAAETRSALRPALVGTTIGAVLAAGLLVAGVPPTTYAILLPFAMLVGFAAGPLLGPGWAQALFTIVISLIFAQVSPADWHLAEARLLDVGVGALVGVVIGLVAWPRGGSGEMHRAGAEFLADAAGVVRETVRVVAEGGRPGDALPRARRTGLLAEASYALYQSERRTRTGVVDWQATLVAGHHAVRGAEALVRDCPTGRLLDCVGPLDAAAADVASRFEHVALGLARRDRTALTAPTLAHPTLTWPTNLGADLYHLADLRAWLDGLREDLSRVTGRAESAEEVAQEQDLDARLANLADETAG
ncbi:FUSC family protein [Pseudonocardia ailaonensis]|uniref:FUSC family protein n=1 Tax=Pseudonocardia ailaonensis TaxID=367279 RepID=A0ABN2MMS6_9PSEU